jgi:GNAT superfamily N-acetyltransferase
MAITTRMMKPNDLNFVFDSWLKSWRSNKYAGVIPNNLYYSTYRSTIEGLVGRGAEVVVAVNSEDEDHILGYVCFETTPDGFSCIHYLYVKDPYLKRGVDAILLEQVKGQKPGFFTFKYSQVTEALFKRWPNLGVWKWAPEIARRK